jgi:ribonuclease P protein subunit RPR2
LKKPRVSKKIVRREVTRLIKLALDPRLPIKYADRYVYLSRKFSMRYQVPIPREFKLFICKGCKRILRPGETAIFRVRARPRKNIYIKCLRCGHVYRRIYKS